VCWPDGHAVQPVLPQSPAKRFAAHGVHAMTEETPSDVKTFASGLLVPGAQERQTLLMPVVVVSQ
jgi:hypothetical protein